MTPQFTSAIGVAKNIAMQRGMVWEMSILEDGKVASDDVWNMTRLVNDVSPSCHYLNNLGFDAKALGILNETAPTPVIQRPVSRNWQDLIKSAAIDQLFVRRNTPAHVSIHIIRPLRIIAMCSGGSEPWQLCPEHVRSALDLAAKIQASGKLRDVVLGVVKTIIDGWQIAEFGPLYPALSEARLTPKHERARFVRAEKDLLADLNDRKRSERLPEKRAFWELVRIVFCEKPQSFTDELRFSAIKVLMICGLRIGEAVMLPADWKRVREYTDASGTDASDLGGFSRSLMLKHFAEKQQSENQDSVVLYPSTQHIPAAFEGIRTEALDRILEITKPLRNTLQQQAEGGRLFPWFDREELVPLIKLYPYMSGQPFWLAMSEGDQNDIMARYKENFDISILDGLADFQRERYTSGRLDGTAYQQLHRMKHEAISGKYGLSLYFNDGSPYVFSKKTIWSKVFVRISEF